MNLDFHAGETLRSYYSSSCSKVPRLLWNQKGLLYAHKNPPFVPILSQMIPVHKTQTLSQRVAVTAAENFIMQRVIFKVEPSTTSYRCSSERASRE
jgi:hypothetical protein